VAGNTPRSKSFQLPVVGRLVGRSLGCEEGCRGAAKWGWHRCFVVGHPQALGWCSWGESGSCLNCCFYCRPLMEA
jgi:hypothetical protein